LETYHRGSRVSRWSSSRFYRTRRGQKQRRVAATDDQEAVDARDGFSGMIIFDPTCNGRGRLVEHAEKVAFD
jgi:hypothetical protein